MSQRTDEPISMTKYVLAYAGVKLAALGAMLGYALTFEGELPNIALAVTMAAVAVPILWFARVVNRPMLGSERMWFAVGNAGAELMLSVTWALGMMWLNGFSIGWEGLNQILGGNGDPEAAKMALIIGSTVGLLQVVFFSALFGWSLTKNLPKDAISSE